jgi:ferredoxin-NADP reductase
MSRPDPIWIDAEIASIRDLTPTIREFTITLGQFAAPPPGSHIKVRIGPNGLDDQRSYSVVDHDDSSLRIAVKRQPESRGGSAHMWSLQPGARLPVAHPECDFPLTYGTPHYLLIAAGVGITPILRMARELARTGASLKMLYAARNAQEFAYASELESLLGDRLILLDSSLGQTIAIEEEIALLPAGSEVYMCGPIGLMQSVSLAWEATGRSPAQLRFETFGSSGRFAASRFTVKIPRLSREIEVAENQTMLEALCSAGVDMISECRRGECGLCAIDILETDGEVDHRDVFFSAREHGANRKMCTCVSRISGGSVTVDPAWRGDQGFTPEPACTAS